MNRLFQPGIRLTCPATPTQVATELSAALAESDYVVAATGADELTASASAPWWRHLIRPKPQRVSWLLTATAAGTTAVLDVRYFRWYFAVFLLLALTVGPALHFGFACITAMQPGQAANWLSALGVLWAVVGMFICFRLLTAGAADEVIRPARSRLEAHGWSLESVGIEANQRYMTVTMAYAAYCLTLILPLIIDLFRAPAQRGTSFAVSTITPLLLLVILLLVIGLLAARRPGFSLRMVPLVPSLGGLLALFFWMAPLLVYSERSRAFKAEENASLVRQVRAALAGEPGARSLSPADAEKARLGLKFLRGQAAVELGGLALLLSLGIAFANRAGRQTTRAWSHIADLQTRTRSSNRDQAVEACGFLVLFRVLFAAFLLMLGWVFGPNLLRCGILAWQSLSTPRLLNVDPVFDTTAFQLSMLLDWPPLDVRAQWLSRFTWTAYALLLAGLWAWSVGGWIRRRRLLRRQLREAPPVPDSLPLEGGTGQLVRLVTVPSEIPFACSFEFFGLRRERFIVLSSRCHRMLLPEERHAILAHEAAHLVAGDCALDSLLQGFGRLFLVGDTFTRAAFLDSYGFEERADRRAIWQFRADPRAMWRGLVRMKHTAAAEGMLRAQHPLIAGIGAVPGGTRTPSGWRLFVRQYTDPGIGYWYPSFEHRKALLLSAAVQDSQAALKA